MLVFDKSLRFCCGIGNLEEAIPPEQLNTAPQIALSGNYEEDVDAFLSYRQQLVQTLSDDPNHSPCKNCAALKYGYYPDEVQIKVLGFFPYYPCNLRCTYCYQWKEAVNQPPEILRWQKEFRLDKLIQAMKKRKLVDEHCEIQISAGEIAINPRVREILSVIKGFPVMLFSNCTVYNEDIAEIISQPRSYLIESLDAGTRETYAKIKGRDVYDTVVSNLERYSTAGAHIQMKYIITPENSNDVDLAGFLDVCQRIKAECVRISCNLNDLNRYSSSDLIDFAVTLGRKCVENELSVLVLPYFGAEKDEYIRTQIYK